MAETWDTSLNTTHISSNLANNEAERTAFWVLYIVDNDGRFDKMIKPTYTGEEDSATDNDRFTNASDILKLHVTKFTEPSFSLEKHQYRQGNDVVTFAGTPTHSGNDGTEITVRDIVGLNTKGILQAWRNLAYNPHTRKGGYMSEYKFEAKLIKYTQKYEPIRQYKIEGIWCSNVTSSSLDKENDAVSEINATLVYDRAIEIDPDAA